MCVWEGGWWWGVMPTCWVRGDAVWAGWVEELTPSVIVELTASVVEELTPSVMVEELTPSVIAVVFRGEGSTEWRVCSGESALLG